LLKSHLPRVRLGQECREIEWLTARIQSQVSAANPALAAAVGVGPAVAAQLLITAGNNPGRSWASAPIAVSPR
jgi:hypothetical protein